MSNLKVPVCKASSVLVQDKEQMFLMIVGGKTNKIQIYNLDAKSWKLGRDAEISRFEGGIHYDPYMQKIYYCGGKDKDEYNKLTDIHEYYDINRDIWSTDGIPQIILGSNPLVWTDADLLYTAAFLNYGFVMQYVDLRCNNKRWNVQEIKNQNKDKPLSHAPYPQAICRLLM